MECTKCHKVKGFNDFTYKNEKDKIYYMYCDFCRIKYFSDEEKNYRERANIEYNMRKLENTVKCECGINYVCFRDFHMIRHLNSNKHKKLMATKK
jgi:hypothetical protein